MPAAARIGDATTGHGCWPPTVVATGSQRVTADGIGIARAGVDEAVPHTCPPIPETHTPHCQDGSQRVFIDGWPAFRVGDGYDCGDAQAEGSPRVDIS